jgi:hypothetical protein
MASKAERGLHSSVNYPEDDASATSPRAARHARREAAQSAIEAPLTASSSAAATLNTAQSSAPSNTAPTHHIENTQTGPPHPALLSVPSSPVTARVSQDEQLEQRAMLASKNYHLTNLTF